jgi:hypothetical protein
MATAKKDWKWFGHAAHFICGHSCRFHLATQVGDYLISTVGEYWPERPSREIHAKYEDLKWLESNGHKLGDDFDNAYMKRFGYETIGCDRKYETMVFKAGAMCKAKDCGCGLPEIASSELDFEGYNDAGSATKGHMELCEKWASAKYVASKLKERQQYA